MPRYFFDIHDGISHCDTEGIELADETAARAHAMMMATAHANDPDMLGTDGGAIVVAVRDAAEQILTVRLAFDVKPK